MPTPLAALDYFPRDYLASRQRFVETCDSLKAERHRLEIDATDSTGAPLSIDVAVVGNTAAPRCLLLSSGVHGVETPLGAAVQQAMLDRCTTSQVVGDDCSLVMLHAVNPYGFAMQRRFNEQNVDLNRNFLLAGEPYSGAPPLAGAFRQVLGSPKKPLRIATSTLRMGYLAARHGQRSFWETLPVGQYEHDDWLFYGGNQLARSGVLLRELLPGLLESAEEVIHLDFHTGLGRWANCELLLSERESSDEAQWWRESFAPFQVVEADKLSRYTARGSFGPWLQELLPHARYHYATAEFGTYVAMQVVRCLADENRWTRAIPNLPTNHWSRRRLAEAFAPKSRRWRTASFDTGIKLVEHASNLLAR